MELKLEIDEQKLVEQKKIRTFGIEIECHLKRKILDLPEGQDLVEKLKSMGNQIGSDGSLSYIDRYSAVEIRTPALSPKLFNKHVTDTCKIINDLGGKTEKSCGLHIHIGNHVQDYRYFIALCEFMQKFEPDIYDMLPDSRRDNTYCKKIDEKFWEKTNDLEQLKTINNLKENFYGTNNTGQSISHRHTKRYYGLNIHSLFYRGTIEFRYHSGTTSSTKILFWKELTNGIFEFVQKYYQDKKKFTEKIGSAKSLTDLLHKEGIIEYNLVDYVNKRIKQFNKKTDPLQTINELFEIAGQTELPSAYGRLIKRMDGKLIVINHHCHILVDADTEKKIVNKLGETWYKENYVIRAANTIITIKNIQTREETKIRLQ